MAYGKGYSSKDKVIKWFWELVEVHPMRHPNLQGELNLTDARLLNRQAMSPDERRELIYFVTGTRALPIEVLEPSSHPKR